MGKKLISLPTKSQTSDHIGDVVKSTLRSDWYNSIFSNYENLAKSNTFSAPFLRSLLPSDTKILRPMIYFRLNTTVIDNQYDINSITCADISSIFEGVYLTVSYAPVAGIRSFCIITGIESEKGLLILS